MLAFCTDEFGDLHFMALGNRWIGGGLFVFFDWEEACWEPEVPFFLQILLVICCSCVRYCGACVCCAYLMWCASSEREKGRGRGRGREMERERKVSFADTYIPTYNLTWDVQKRCLHIICIWQSSYSFRGRATSPHREILDLLWDTDPLIYTMSTHDNKHHFSSSKGERCAVVNIYPIKPGLGQNDTFFYGFVFLVFGFLSVLWSISVATYHLTLHTSGTEYLRFESRHWGSPVTSYQ